ncbi:hypothetical protein C0Q70_05090 [Pomacea canaliculata]|uniref:Cytochrome P450 n=1 Tax=Pomacea canaliculata TaxID=400727 RepID=A0A2T7PK69_POMCA|nr:hypothetical protein C0Q70_05090 [Pomacea canaliculata]
MSHLDTEELKLIPLYRILPTPVFERFSAAQRVIRSCQRRPGPNGPYYELCRMYPVAPGLGRTLQSDAVIAGYHVPAGVNECGSPLRHGGKDNRFISSPEVFSPERWLRSNRENISPFITLPFGFGPRSCPGRRLAVQEVSIVIAKLLQRFNIVYNGDELPISMQILNTPAESLSFTFEKRNLPMMYAMTLARRAWASELERLRSRSRRLMPSVIGFKDVGCHLQHRDGRLVAGTDVDSVVLYETTLTSCFFCSIVLKVRPALFTRFSSPAVL